MNNPDRAHKDLYARECVAKSLDGKIGVWVDTFSELIGH